MPQLPTKFNFDRQVVNHPQRSVFNMSYDHKFTCNPGELIPCYAQEVVPGDKINHSLAFVVKSLPLVSPAMADFYVYFHCWYVPYRILQSHETIEAGSKFKVADTNIFENYINGIHEGMTMPYLANSSHEWNVRNCLTSEVTTGNFAYIQVPTPSSSPASIYGLLDYLGIGKNNGDGSTIRAPRFVSQFPVRAYNAIYNTKYRNKNIQDDSYSGVGASNPDFALNDDVTNGLPLDQVNILRRNWESDYFTTLLPWLQMGTPIALPVSSSISWDTGAFGPGSLLETTWDPHGNFKSTYVNNTEGGTTGTNVTRVAKIVSTAFDINNLREANAIQRYNEANARGYGSSYHTFCLAHFGVAERDETLNSPIYLGGSKTPLMISEVTQTSESATSPQGTLTGKANSADNNFIFNYEFKSHGIVLGLFSIMPKPVYAGVIDRMWIKEDVYSWYSCEFANLGEQAIYNMELNGQIEGSDVEDDYILGYQGRWSEMRVRQSIASADFTVSTGESSGSYGGLADWIVLRQSNNFRLNSSFLVCRPNMSIFAYPNSKNFIVDVANIVKMERPLPALAKPMLVG